jgi:hypothetical protein
MLLLTFERDGKYLVKDLKEVNPAIQLHTISNIQADSFGEFMLLLGLKRIERLSV